MKPFATLVAALLLSAVVPLAASAQCTTATPVDVPILAAAIDAISNGGANDGSYDFAGTADCGAAPAFDASEALAVASAASLPAYLGDKETFSVSGGLGFSDGETAIGGTAMVRIHEGLAAFAGGAGSTSGDTWVAKAGLRFGW